MKEKRPKRYMWAYEAWKRSTDIAVAVVVLVCTLPIQVSLAALIRLVMGKPVIFRQKRPGLNGELFEILKFRTMRNSVDPHRVEADRERLTRLGQLLRVTSLDELPTMVNVLKGEMSLVGPRPLLADYLSMYSSEEARRHDVRPGITGLAQVNGRNALSWEEKFRLDLFYVEHRSVRLDLYILWKTVGTVTGRRGISAPGSVTIQRFFRQAED